MTKKDEEKEKVVQKRIDLSRDYQKVFGSAAGKRVLHDIMARGNMLQPTANDTQGNIHLMDRNEGRRELVLHILAALKYSPEKLMDLLDNSDEDEGDHL